MSAASAIAQLNTHAPEKAYSDQPAYLTTDGVQKPPQLYNVYIHAANGAPDTDHEIQLLDGGAIRTITFPADMSAYVGRKFTFLATGTARAHVIAVTTAGDFGGDDSITFPGATSNEGITVFVTAADNVQCVSQAHVAAADEYTLA